MRRCPPALAAYHCGYGLHPRDPRANWIDSLEGAKYREATEAYHLGQSSRWTGDDRSAEEVLGDATY